MATQVLVTGATGFVGGRLAHRLRERGDGVIALVRTPAQELTEIGVEQVGGGFDAVDDALLARVDAVVHAAASGDPDLEVAREVNQRGTRRLIDHALAAGTGRFVHVSTTSVYDLAAVGDAEVDEVAPLVTAGANRPPTSSAGSAYAVSKAEGEAEVARGAAVGLSCAILRPPAVLGAGPTSTWGTRIPTALQDGSWQPPHPDTTYGWVHVDDLVDAVVAALDDPVDATVNVVGGHTTFGAYVDAIRAVVPDPPPEVPASSDGPRWQGRYADDRLPAILGLRPERRFEEGMAEIAAWWSGQAPG